MQIHQRFLVVVMAAATTIIASGQNLGPAPGVQPVNDYDLLTARENAFKDRLVRGIADDLAPVSACNVSAMDGIFSRVDKEREEVRTAWTKYYLGVIDSAREMVKQSTLSLDAVKKANDQLRRKAAVAAEQLNRTTRNIVELSKIDESFLEYVKALDAFAVIQSKELGELRALSETIAKETEMGKKALAERKALLETMEANLQKKGIADQEYQALLQSRRRVKSIECRLAGQGDQPSPLSLPIQSASVGVVSPPVTTTPLAASIPGTTLPLTANTPVRTAPLADGPRAGGNLFVGSWFGSLSAKGALPVDLTIEKRGDRKLSALFVGQDKKCTLTMESVNSIEGARVRFSGRQARSLSDRSSVPDGIVVNFEIESDQTSPVTLKVLGSRFSFCDSQLPAYFFQKATEPPRSR